MVTINLSLAVRSYSVGCARETLADRSLVWQRKTTVLLVSLGALSSVQHQAQLRRYSIWVSCFSDGIRASIRVQTPAVLTMFFALFRIWSSQ